MRRANKSLLSLLGLFTIQDRVRLAQPRSRQKLSLPFFKRLIVTSSANQTSFGDELIELLEDRGVKIFDRSEFVREDYGDPICKRNIAARYPAKRTKGPGAGDKVCLKAFMGSVDNLIVAIGSSRERECILEKALQYFYHECCILKHKETHPNIQKCLGLVKGLTTLGSDLPVVVYSEVSVGDLQTFVFRNPQATIEIKLKLMRDVASALAFLHQKGISHGDISSKNVLVDGQHGSLKALLSDFGCAEDFGNLFVSNRDIQMRDSLGWLAPEIWKDYRPSGQVRVFDGGARDMWAFGCTMVEVLARERFPWPIGYDDNTIGDALISYERPPRLPSFPPWDEAWRFIHDRCWCIDPLQRIKAHEAITELEALSESKPYADDLQKN